MNEELQIGIIGDFLYNANDAADLRVLASKYRLKPVHFTDPVARDAFKIVIDAQTNDNVLLGSDVAHRCGGKFVENAIRHASASILDVEERIRRLANTGIINEIWTLADKQLHNADGKESADVLIANFNREMLAIVTGGTDTTAADDGYSLAELSDPVPEDQDPDALIANRWLCKGSAAALASVSGSGKSVMTMQIAYAWACGKPVFGIRPLRPLKIGIFQTEDDQEEIKTFRISMRAGHRMFHGWSDDELHAAEKNIHFRDTKGTTGEAFIARFREVQVRNRFDLVFINPLQAVAGCDISRNDQLTAFLRQGLDSVIKDDTLKCGLFIIHHTNKPPSARERGGFGKDQYAEYVGAGGAELTNWLRAMLTLMPTSETGVYQLVAAKRGQRFDWPVNPATKCPHPCLFLRHSNREPERLLFWQEATGYANAAVTPTAAAKTAINPKADAELLASHLQKVPRTMTDARAYARDLLGRSKKRYEAAYGAITKDPGSYGLVIAKTGNGAQSVIGTVEGVQAEIAAMNEKEAQKLIAKARNTKVRTVETEKGKP